MPRVKSSPGALQGGDGENVTAGSRYPTTSALAEATSFRGVAVPSANRMTDEVRRQAQPRDSLSGLAQNWCFAGLTLLGRSCFSKQIALHAGPPKRPWLRRIQLQAHHAQPAHPARASLRRRGSPGSTLLTWLTRIGG
jgi:hypothetical protein